ncbi:glycosyltransferase family 39 protein [Actinoplanes sp. NEAU-A12]|uniref:Glycosyltransferase family 39 protein n=1 Tax=Actinoplanes sandaracinus TaxID=3045177 RepID=A0ABT6WPW3_9ACTN|nr:phospholipid carrier-dependent glycosyltransferase [Actinoplanes sandaracinus]MDI6101791.1 glycosyltransferase family 39 protein [Actinoplanes sandaracinus]
MTTTSEPPQTTTALIPKARSGVIDVTRPLVPAHDHQPSRVRRRELTGGEGLLAGGLTALVLAVLTVNITGFPMASDDEGTYLAQAWAVATGKGLAHYTYWYDHPPLAWIQLAALSWIPGLFQVDGPAVMAARVAMIPVVAACLLLVYLVCRRLGMAVWAAAAGLLIFGLSPLTITMYREIYLDTFAVTWMLGALALVLSPRRNLWHYTAAGAATALAVLSKETMLVTLPAVCVALWQNAARSSTRPWAVGGYLSGLVLVGMFYPLYALLRGELFPGPGHVSLIGAWQFQLANRSGTGSIFEAGAGSHELVKSWLFYDPVILLAGLAATVPALVVRRLRPAAVAAVILVLVAIRPGGYLPAMYVVQILPFFAIVIAGMLDVTGRAVPAHRRWWRPALATVAVLLAATLIGPRWWAGNQRALTAADNAGYTAAADYLRTSVPDRAGATVVVDDVLWLDCVNAGYPEEQVIWFYKLDLDPAVAARMPNGWRDVDYLVSTPALRQDPGSLPLVNTLLTNSTVEAAFGPADGRIEIRRINKEIRS